MGRGVFYLEPPNVTKAGHTYATPDEGKAIAAAAGRTVHKGHY